MNRSNYEAKVDNELQKDEITVVLKGFLHPKSTKQSALKDDTRIGPAKILKPACRWDS